MKTNKLNLFLLLLPTIFAFVFKFIIRDYRDELMANFIVEALLYVALVPLLYSSIIKSVAIKKKMFFLVTTISVLAILFECIYYHIYGAIIGPSTIYFILETNENESVEFFKNVADLTLIALFVVFPVLGYFSYKASLVLIENLSKISLKSNKIFVIVYCFTTGALAAVLHQYDHLKYNTPYLACQSVLEYSEFTASFKNLGFADGQGYFENVERQEVEDEETFVVIVGESTTRGRMSLYGYTKNTNPRLNEIKGELDVFENVISPHIGTILSLGKVLTTNSVVNSKKIAFKDIGKLMKGAGCNTLNDRVGSIIQLYNHAGFKTFWLSNQRPMGIHENLITEISKGADVQHFINISNHDESTPYDGALLVPLEKALADSSKKKIIFLHLLGTHTHYEFRYPEEFDHFEGEEFNFLEKAISKQKLNKVLAVKYDNAVRYNDYVVREVIEKVRKQNQSSFVLYFSDHGEDLSPKKNMFVGRNLEEITRSMYEIPLILWRSPKYRRQYNNATFDITHKFMSDDLIHAVADLSHISFKGFHEDRSIFNTKYCEIPRIIMSGKDFEEEFGVAIEKSQNM